MPSRNIIKIDADESYYHVYARGRSKQIIFLEKSDYLFFIGLFARYLSRKPAHNIAGLPYAHYRSEIKLLTYCLMPNHFHLLVYQTHQRTMSAFMRSVMASYSRYFNIKYGQSGSPFESCYKASRIEDQTYLEHISRYIHLNPYRWARYPYSSIDYYSERSAPVEWLSMGEIKEIFDSTGAYISFLQDYEEHKKMLDEIKKELANNNC